MLQAGEARAETKIIVRVKTQTEIHSGPGSGDQEQREELVEAFLPLVRLIAERVHRRLPSEIDLESLVQAGVIGLLEALSRYDPDRGAFPAYARHRIQGEIVEDLRSLDWASRSVRAWGRKATAARTHLTGRLGREASTEEMAAELGVSLKQYYRIDQKLNDAVMVSLDNVSLASEEGWEKAQEEFCQDSFQDPLSFLESKNLIGKLTTVIEELSERERLVVTLYYHEELTLREIGEILSLTEGRISQIHSGALSRLRRSLGAET